MRGYTLNGSQDGQRTLGDGWDDLTHLMEIVDALRRSGGISRHNARQAVGSALAGHHNFDGYCTRLVLSQGFAEGVVEVEVAELGSPASNDDSLPDGVVIGPSSLARPVPLGWSDAQ